MRKIVITGILFFALWAVKAQEKDSTRIKLGKSTITIYDENAKELEALKKSQAEFKVKVQALRDSIAQISAQMENQNDSTLSVKLKNNIAELKKQAEAFQEGIDDLSREIENLQEERYAFKFESGDEEDEKADQENDNWWEDEDNNSFEFTKTKRRFKGHWAGFDMGINNYLNNSQQMSLPTNGKFMELNTNKSWAFALNIAQFNIPLFSRYIGLVTGFGVSWNGYEFKQNMKLAQDADGVIYGKDYQDTTFKKNKLNVTYFKVPLIMEFQIPVNSKDRRLFVGAGVEGKLKLRAKYKQKYDISGKEQKDVSLDDYQLNPLNYGLTARLGYRGLRLYATYSLTPLFEKAQGPELYPFEVGITIIDF